jgi:hypothetical protein
MTHRNSRYPATKHQWMLRSAFGVVAALATAATLGLAVIAPTAAATAESIARVDVPTRVAAQPFAPTEVAILPGTIEVVVYRTRNSRNAGSYNTGSYVPAAYHPHR